MPELLCARRGKRADWLKKKRKNARCDDSHRAFSIIRLSENRTPGFAGKDKKALATRNERSERKFCQLDAYVWGNRPFTGGSVSDVGDRIFDAAQEACWYQALLGFIQAPGLAGGFDCLFFCTVSNASGKKQKKAPDAENRKMASGAK